MQTFFNPTTPFFDGEGHLLVDAAVSFLDTGTSGSLITIKDSDGVTLPNPLYTGSDGRMRLDNGALAVPCIADGLSYKVAVARRTGVEPVYVGDILQNAAELYEEPYIVFVVNAMGNAEGEDLNTTCVGSIAEVRLVDKAIGTVVCSGYYSAGDCPARVFKWVDSVNPPADNAINVLRNPDDATGYWKMSEPEGGLWDVRMAGCMTSNTPSVNDQCLTRLVNVIDASSGNSKVATVYFPAGNWLLESGYTFASLVLEAGANLKPADNSADRTINAARLENRGGTFQAYGTASSDKRILIVTGSALRTSWLKGTLNDFLTAAVIAAPEEIIFDAIDRVGGSGVTIENKVVRVYNGVSIPSSPSAVKFSDCFVMFYGNGKFYSTEFHISGNNESLGIDIDGIKMGDTTSSVEINHSGMVAKNSDESYVMNLDFHALEFTAGQKTGTYDSEKVHLVIQQQGSATLDISGLDAGKGNDYIEAKTDGIALHIEDDVDDTDVTIDEDGIKFSKDYSGHVHWAKLDGQGIDSDLCLGISSGSRYPWIVKTVKNTSPDIDDSVFTGVAVGHVIVKAYHTGDNSTFVSNVTATPTDGRVIRIVYTSDSDLMGTRDLDKILLTIKYNSTTISILQLGGSVTLVANGSGWAVDYQRI